MFINFIGCHKESGVSNPSFKDIASAYNIEYVKYYKKLYNNYLKFIQRNNIPVICPCCDSIKLNWTPSYKIWDIMFEILRFEDTISNILVFRI